MIRSFIVVSTLANSPRPARFIKAECHGHNVLKRRGVTIVSEPRDVAEIGRRFAFFADPWGNLFEVIQPISN